MCSGVSGSCSQAGFLTSTLMMVFTMAAIGVQSLVKKRLPTTGEQPAQKMKMAHLAMPPTNKRCTGHGSETT